MSEPRQYTTEEIRQQFFDHLNMLIDYWASINKDKKEVMQGLVHSILCIFDGVTVGTPSFILAPTCHPDDPEYLKEEGSNWYPYNDDGKYQCEITDGCHLHEIWNRK